MGCVSAKLEGGETQNRRPNANLEDAIQKNHNGTSIEQKKDLMTVNDIVAKASDFVVSHENTQDFAKLYVLDNQIIGEGAFGRVQKCKSKATGEVCAVKIIDAHSMSASEKVRLQHEIKILKNLTHPNIVRLYEVF